jgi:hypothetical protein
MAFVVKDRVKETTATTGTGTVTLSGAATGFQSFSVIGNANETYYCIAGQGTSEFEVGIGTYTSSGTLLSRTTVLSSSNSGSLVNFSAGTKDVFVTFPAGIALQQTKYDLYTSGTATWTAPTGVTSIKVICIGGGGGGGDGIATGGGCDPVVWQTGGSGGYGGIAVGIYTVVPGTGYVATVGAGGAGSNTAAGSSGATSSLGSLLSATGGSGAGGSGADDGANGAGATGITGNGSVVGGAGGSFTGSLSRAQAVSSTAAVTWTAALNRVPGARGTGESGSASTGNNDATGGTGGAVYIEYIG